MDPKNDIGSLKSFLDFKVVYPDLDPGCNLGLCFKLTLTRDVIKEGAPK